MLVSRLRGHTTGDTSPKYLYFALVPSGDCYVGPDSRLPFWRSDVCSLNDAPRGLSFHDDPDWAEIARSVERRSADL